MGFMDVLDPIGIRKLFQDPSADSMKYLNQIPGQIQQYMGPYNDAGKGSIGTLQGQYGNLLNDPGGFMNTMGKSFQQSPGFKFALEQALGAGDRAAAAGGMAGSPMHQQQNMQLATNLGNQEYNNWLQGAMGFYGRGLSGTENMFNVGAQTGREMGQDMSTSLMNQAMMRMFGNVTRNQNVGNLVGMAGRFALGPTMGM